MVASDMEQVADVIFVFEGTAINGAYINDLKQNYIIPTLEYFSQGIIDDRDYYKSDRACTMYGIILYKTAQSGLGVCCLTHGPFSSPQKVLNTIERLELTGGRSESNANLAEGMATALVCFDDLDERREPNFSLQKHCILICNSPPYSMPVMECPLYENKNVEQLATIFQEKNINLSILSPRKIPILFKIFEKSGGDLSQSTSKNYCKDPRHLVLLKGYSLKERPISPSLQQSNSQAGQINHNIPSPLNEYNIRNQLNNQIFNEQNQMQNCKFNSNNPMGQPGGPVVPGGMGPRPILGGMMDQTQQQQQQQNMNQQFVQQQANQQQQQQAGVGVGVGGGIMQQGAMVGGAVGGPLGYMGNQQNQQQANLNRGGPNPRWMMPPQQQPQQQQQQRQYLPNQMNPNQGQQQVPPNNQQNSVLISQLSTPPHSMNNQIGNQQINNLNQQQMIRMQLLNQQQQQQQQMVQNQQMQQQQQNPQQTNPNLLNSGMQSQQGPNNQVLLNQNQLNQNQQQQVNPNPNQQPQQQQQQQQQPNPNAQMGQMQQQAQMREKIWSGIIEWPEKVKPDQPKITRHVPCFVTTNSKDGELDIKADNWPPRLIMQLMPKHIIGNIGGQYLKDSKTVILHPSPCDSLDALVKVMASGFAGCVHFNTPNNHCDLKVLILLYTHEKKAFLGFIPNNQSGFVDRLRKVIAQKQGASRLGQTQQQQQQGQPNLQQGNLTPSGNNITNPSQSQNSQMMQQMVQTSTSQMNVQQTSNQQQQLQQQAGPRMGMVNMPGVPVPPNVGNPNQMQNLRGPSPQLQQQVQQQQRFDFEQRQPNMEKISHLKQTLEQQVQQDFKSYDAYGQMPMQMQDAMQPVQQQTQQDQYNKLLMMQQQQQQQQRNVGNLVNPQANQVNAQRMMRPVMANNPGLRHLLQQQQQQPQNSQQYRQVMGMQNQNPGQMGGVPRPQQQNQNNQQFDDQNFDFFGNNE